MGRNAAIRCSEHASRRRNLYRESASIRSPLRFSNVRGNGGFSQTELDATLAVIELLDASQHMDEFPDFQDKCDWVLLRVEMASGRF